MVMYAIDVAPKAERQLKKIAKTDQQAYRDIRDGIKELRNWPAVTDLKALKQHT
jgi:mRNA-degrading endonuclease RelE of RelBE toxin-antitoxin system